MGILGDPCIFLGDPAFWGALAPCVFAHLNEQEVRPSERYIILIGGNGGGGACVGGLVEGLAVCQGEMKSFRILPAPCFFILICVF